jgi:hypothetical protein
LDARVASASSNDILIFLLLLNKSGLGFGSNRLWCNNFSCAVDDLAILDKTLDHPVIISTTEVSIVHTALAKVKVTFITSAAMIMLIRNRLTALVAVDREYADRWGSWNAGVVANGILTLVGNGSKFCEPSIASSRTTSDGNLGGGARAHLWGLLLLERVGMFTLEWAGRGACSWGCGTLIAESRVVDQ